MAWPVFPHGFLGAQGDSDTYRIERSLRFNSADSAYLNRTPSSAGNQKTWTWSSWVKIGNLSTERIFLSNTDTSGRYGLYCGFRIPNTFEVGDYGFGSYDWVLTTTQLFRDTSSWYHIVVSVDTTQSTASNRVRVYLNGSQITSFSASSYPSQNSDLRINSTSPMSIGRVNNGSYFFDGYLTEINFIDGQALTPSSFGETDAITGRWKAKAYSGTYGTNGFYLKFADNSGTTATTLGKDSSGNGNNWTPNNFSVTAGAGNDSLVDSPTNYGTDSYSTSVDNARGNYCTLNPLAKIGGSATSSNGNLEFARGATQYSGVVGSIAIPSSGKYYFEVNGGTATSFTAGFCNESFSYGGTNRLVYTGNGQKINKAGTNSNYGASFSGTDVVGVAINADSQEITFYKNGSSQGVAFSGSDYTGFGQFFPYAQIDDASNTTAVFNFGQRPFAYTAPSGFKALCTQNLTQPTIQKPSTAMDVVTYTGTGGTQAISGLNFEPDLVWIKNRSAAWNNNLTDSVRGATKALFSDLTDAENTNSIYGYVSAFNSNGFTTIAGSTSGNLVNQLSSTYVAWSWDAGSTNSTNNSGSITSTVRANPQAGFSIVSYTGNGTAGATVGHGLGVAPKMIIAKFRSTTSDWPVYHASITNAQNGGLNLNKTDAFTVTSSLWNNTSPTSSVFTIGSGLATNLATVIAYCFAEVEGYSKFGSYTGNGSSDGPFVWCGFRPRYFIIKRTDSTGGWWTWDSARNTFNAANSTFRVNNANAEDTDSSNYNIDLLSNGIKIRATSFTADGGMNVSGGTYIFAAFAESAFKYCRAR